MTQPPKGPGALPLLLRLSMLRARQRGGGSLAEQGYSLAVALIASFVLLLGVGALASRGQLGFIGQAFQVQNRQARDVAESAIADFANTMNREPNRHILVSGTANKTDWLQTDRALDNSLNICTAYNADGTKNTVGGNPVIIPPDEDEVARFLPGETTDLGNGRSFEVQNVEYLMPDRVEFDRGSTFEDGKGDTQNLREELILPGSTRTLVRITVIGNVDQNGRTSSARVSREFEIVPKCCNRSFGRNQAGGVNNWGRDQRDCFGGGDVPGLLVGLGGSGPGGGQPGTYVGGKGPLNNVIQEDGSSVTNISCLEGANADCAGTGYDIGTSRRISVNPFAGPLPDFPEYNNPSDPAMGHTTITFSSRSIVYFDPDVASNLGDAYYNSTDPADPNYLPLANRPSGLVLDGLTGITPDGSPTRLNGKALNDPSVDICYESGKFNTTTSPYSIVHCRAQNFVVTDDVVIDTSAARINFFFDDPAFSGDYLSLSGNTAVIRTHDFRTTAEFGTQGVNCLPGSNLADCQIRWPTGTPPITDIDRENTFLELCSYRLTGCDDKEYAVRNLFNFYANGTGQFKYNGTADAEGYNIYAPSGAVLFFGTTSFMGQIWTDRFYINGNSTVFTFESSDGKAATGFGVPLFDFIARSFTQSSGF